MSDIPKIEMPAGATLRENEDGSLTVVLDPTGEPLSKTIAFRTTSTAYVGMLAWRESFADRTWASAFRWLFAQPEVTEAITRRMAAQTRRREQS